MATRASLDAEYARTTEMIRRLAALGSSANDMAIATGLHAHTIRDRCRVHSIAYRKLSTNKSQRNEITNPNHLRVLPPKPLPGGRHRSLGHRFGWDLVCPCGRGYEEHQKAPMPCPKPPSGKEELPPPPPPPLPPPPPVTCPRGFHPWPEFQYVYPNGQSECRECRRTRQRLGYKRKKLGILRDESICNKGLHRWPEELYVNPNSGSRQCRGCEREWARRKAARLREGEG